MLKYDVFICHETTTASHLAINLREALKRIGIKGFAAKEDIQSPERWNSTIDGAISESRYFILILTYPALTSYEVKREVDLAEDLGKPIIPCKEKDLPFELVERRFPKLINTQYIEFSHEYDLANNCTSLLVKKFPYFERFNDLLDLHGTISTLSKIPCLKISKKEVERIISEFIKKAVKAETWYEYENVCKNTMREVKKLIESIEEILCASDEMVKNDV